MFDLGKTALWKNKNVFLNITYITILEVLLP